VRFDNQGGEVPSPVAMKQSYISGIEKRQWPFHATGFVAENVVNCTVKKRTSQLAAGSVF
jgi:hypothetical protein